MKFLHVGITRKLIALIQNEVERLVSIAKNENVMVLCSEEHYEFCHRALLTDYLKKIDDNLSICTLDDES